MLCVKNVFFFVSPAVKNFVKNALRIGVKSALKKYAETVQSGVSDAQNLYAKTTQSRTNFPSTFTVIVALKGVKDAEI